MYCGGEYIVAYELQMKRYGSSVRDQTQCSLELSDPMVVYCDRRNSTSQGAEITPPLLANTQKISFDP